MEIDMKKYVQFIRLCLCIASGMTFFSCNKAYQEEIALRENESGIIGVNDRENTAMRGQTITLFAKVSNATGDINIYVGNALATVLTHGKKDIVVKLSGQSTATRTVVADTFNLIVPEAADIGATNIYMSINSVKCPPLAFTIKKPDILYPGKVTVSPLLLTPWAPFSQSSAVSPVDGALGTATIGEIKDMGLDKDGNIYFIDNGKFEWNPSGGNYNMVTATIRKYANGQITTLGGNGSNEFATVLKDLKLFEISCMKIGKDGMIYLAVTNQMEKHITFPGTENQLDIVLPVNRILKIDPRTGMVTKLVGRDDRLCIQLGGYVVMADGPADKAMVGFVKYMELDKDGNLYFLDGGSSGGSMIRVLTKEGMVSTVAGRPDDFGEYEFWDDNATHSEKMMAGSYVDGHSADGFGIEVQIGAPKGMAMAGNGKFYIAQAKGTPEMKECIREFNPATKELVTIIGKPANAAENFQYSGTFKEVDMRSISSFDADFDGNILVGYDHGNFTTIDPMSIYKIDVNKEMVYKIAGYGGMSDPTVPQPGNTATLGIVNRIVFDQFGKLYIAYTRFDYKIWMSTITVERL
jgi:hypothetical protein